MPPTQQLPYDARRFASADAYVDSLIEFSRNPLLRVLCGGVHILDFFTKDCEGYDDRDAHDDNDGGADEPRDLYSAILPATWRRFFGKMDMDQVLELLLRTPVDEYGPEVPRDLVDYVRDVREYSLQREFAREESSTRTRKQTRPGTERALYAGMKPKKVHEVSLELQWD